MKYVKPINLYREVVKMSKGRLLGVSVRRNCIRLAVSYADNKLSAPSISLANNKIGEPELLKLQRVISANSISGLVIGYPFVRELGLPTAGKQTKRFVKDLTKTGEFKDMYYTYWDDYHLKSMAIEQRLMKYNIDTLSLFEAVDEASACEILQGYLDFFKRNEDQTTFAGGEWSFDLSKLNQDQTTFVGEHGYVDFGNRNPK